MFAHAAERKIEWWLMMVGETAAFNIVAVIDRARQKDFLGGILPLGGPKHGGPSQVPSESRLYGALVDFWDNLSCLIVTICFECGAFFAVVGVGGLILGPYPFMGSGGQFQVLSPVWKYKSTNTNTILSPAGKYKTQIQT